MVYDEESTLLMTPGPCEFHPRVYRAMSRKEYHHRTSEYRGFFSGCVSMLKDVMQTKNDIFIIAGSGTAAMDAAVANCVAPGDKVLNIINGKFSKRLMEITETYGGETIPVKAQWGMANKADEVAEALENNPDVKFVTMCHNSTSTGVLNPAKEIGDVVKKYDKILIADCVTSVGGDYVFPDKWNLDIVVTGSQKCLGCPPGLGMVIVSPRAWQVIEGKSRVPTYYLDLKAYKQKFEKDSDTPYTSSIPLVYALHEALTLIREEGCENRFKRHRLMAEAFRRGVRTIDLELLAEKGYESNTVTAVKYPKDINDASFRRTVRSHGVLIAGGQEQLKGRVFRVAHMNMTGAREILLTMAVLEMSLSEGGFRFEKGAGVKAVETYLLGD